MNKLEIVRGPFNFFFLSNHSPSQARHSVHSVRHGGVITEMIISLKQNITLITRALYPLSPLSTKGGGGREGVGRTTED